MSTVSTSFNPPVQRDTAVIAVIGLAHGTSHFFHLLLPPLFPWLMTAFGLDFSRIGLTMTVFFVISGVGQALAGFAVDRFGPVRVLLFGMSCFLLAGLSLGLFAHSLTDLFLVAALAGLGNSVLHPSDYSVLNRKVSTSRLGHAFSVHGISGNLGWALAPVFLTGISALAGWKVAAIAAGAMALPAMFMLWIFRDQLDINSVKAGSESHPRHGTFSFLSVGAVWLCFAFFFLTTVAFGAFQNFGTPVLQHLYGLPLGAAATALSTFLLVAACGIFVGGFVAQHRAQDHIIAIVLTMAAVLALFLSMELLPAWSVLPVMAGIGFFTGIAGPSRDLLVRRAATARFGQAAYGRIYGFVYSGLDSGLALSPLVFGHFMDTGHYASVLIGIAIFQGLAVLTALRVGRSAPIAAAK
ncbi:fosmidomycin resistance protein [mine drainage metagenome]|uniref:Fosmidomycin resistance protein n=1 Tax=mine drainage metagenome TaxID=410659 RepID=A0A1J5RUD9_9ZZZZ